MYIVIPRRPSWMKNATSHTKKSRDMLRSKSQARWHWPRSELSHFTKFASAPLFHPHPFDRSRKRQPLVFQIAIYKGTPTHAQGQPYGTPMRYSALRMFGRATEPFCRMPRTSFHNAVRCSRIC